MPHAMSLLAGDAAADAVAVVLRRAFDDRLPWLAGRHTPDADRAFFRADFGRARFLGVWGEGLLGFAAVAEGWLHHLYVLPAHQGAGIGSALLEAARADVDTLQLWTFRRNLPARRFYEARGLVLIRETDGSRNEEGEPDVLYRWGRGDG